MNNTTPDKAAADVYPDHDTMKMFLDTGGFSLPAVQQISQLVSQ